MDRKRDFASADLTAGQLNALVEMLGGPEMALGILRERVRITLSDPNGRWRLENGVIRCSFVLDGRRGTEWLSCLRDQNFTIDAQAETILLSTGFETFKDLPIHVRLLSKERYEGDHSSGQFASLSMVAACIVQELLDDEACRALGLGFVIAMHQPIRDSPGGARHLAVYRNGGRAHQLTTYDTKSLAHLPDTWFLVATP